MTNTHARHRGAFDRDDARLAYQQAQALANAAPDLLAALDNLLRVTVDAMLADGIALTDQEQAARDQALAAIAKARP